MACSQLHVAEGPKYKSQAKSEQGVNLEIFASHRHMEEIRGHMKPLPPAAYNANSINNGTIAFLRSGTLN